MKLCGLENANRSHIRTMEWETERQIDFISWTIFVVLSRSDFRWRLREISRPMTWVIKITYCFEVEQIYEVYLIGIIKTIENNILLLVFFLWTSFALLVFSKNAWEWKMFNVKNGKVNRLLNLQVSGKALTTNSNYQPVSIGSCPWKNLKHPNKTNKGEFHVRKITLEIRSRMDAVDSLGMRKFLFKLFLSFFILFLLKRVANSCVSIIWNWVGIRGESRWPMMRQVIKLDFLRQT